MPHGELTSIKSDLVPWTLGVLFILNSILLCCLCLHQYLRCCIKDKTTFNSFCSLYTMPKLEQKTIIKCSLCNDVILFAYVCISVCICLCVYWGTCVQVPREARGIRVPGTGNTSICEFSDKHNENQTQVLMTEQCWWIFPSHSVP